MTLSCGGAATIELNIPMRAEYVSIARLTAAGVANRLDLDIDAIEDIKVSLSEVCNRIINIQNKYSRGYEAECRIEFVLSGICLTINVFVDDAAVSEHFMPEGAPAGGPGIDLESLIDERHEEEFYKDHLQLTIIGLLMDEFLDNPAEGCIVSMKKCVE